MTAGQFYSALFYFDGAFLSPELALAATWKDIALLALASLVVLLPRSFNGGRFLAETDAPPVARAGILLVALPYALLQVAGFSFSPFLYFRF